MRRQRLGRQRVEAADPELPLAERIDGGEHDAAPVRRHGGRPGEVAGELKEHAIGRRRSSARTDGSPVVDGDSQFEAAVTPTMRGDDETGEQPRDRRHRRALRDRRGWRLVASRPELEDDVARRLPAIVGILLETSRDDVIEPAGVERLARRGRRRMVIEDRRR